MNEAQRLFADNAITDLEREIPDSRKNDPMPELLRPGRDTALKLNGSVAAGMPGATRAPVAAAPKAAKTVRLVWLSAGVVALGVAGGILAERFEPGTSVPGSGRADVGVAATREPAVSARRLVAPATKPVTPVARTVAPTLSATLGAPSAPKSPRAAAPPTLAALTQASIARSGRARALEAPPAPTVTSAVAGEGAPRLTASPSPVARVGVDAAKRESRPARESTATRPELTLARPEPVSLASNLRLEIDLIDAARDMLRTRSSARSLEILDQYSVRFPDGSLAPEGMALRVEALMRLGRTAEARAVARQFVAANPTSPLVARMNPLASGATPP